MKTANETIQEYFKLKTPLTEKDADLNVKVKECIDLMKFYAKAKLEEAAERAHRKNEDFIKNHNYDDDIFSIDKKSITETPLD